MPALAPLDSPSPKRTSSTDRIPVVRAVTVKLTGVPTATTAALAVTSTVRSGGAVVDVDVRLVELDEVVEAVELDGVTRPVEAPPHDAPLSATRAQNITTRRARTMPGPCPRSERRRRGVGHSLGGPRSSAPNVSSRVNGGWPATAPREWNDRSYGHEDAARSSRPKLTMKLLRSLAQKCLIEGKG